MSHTKITGIAILTVLLFLQILAILSMFALQMTWVESKAAQHLWQQHVMKNASKTILKKLEQQIENTQCDIPILSTEALLNKPLSWWASRPSCAGNLSEFKYYYGVERLGSDPCAYIQLKPNILIANYLRISLRVLGPMSKTLLQSTVVLPITAQTDCQIYLHQVAAGRQMSRELFLEKDNKDTIWEI